MLKNKTKGFTLIELLVVIAIIGVLASIALPALNTARTKGADTAIKGNLASMRAQAEIYYDQYSSVYSSSATLGVCESAPFVNAIASMSGAGGSATCHEASDGKAWAMSSTLKSSGSWCVDSAGASRAISAALGSGVTVCPAN